MDKQTQDMFTALQMRIDSLEKKLDTPIVRANENVDKITPYIESKTAGMQDTKCVFDGHYQQGVISAMVVTDRGTLIPNTIERSDDNITVRFEELEETATVTIQIQ